MNIAHEISIPKKRYKYYIPLIVVLRAVLLLLDHPDGQVVQQRGPLGRQLVRVQEVRVETEI